MPFTNGPQKKFGLEEKIKMFERLGSIGAILALVIIVMIESGRFAAYQQMLDTGLTAMIVVLAVALVGSVFFKTRRK